MKAVLALGLILLLIVIVLPIAMGMGGMPDCPMCTNPDTHLALGICAAILSLMGLVVTLASRRFHTVEERTRASLILRSIYRPPRSA